MSSAVDNPSSEAAPGDGEARPGPSGRRRNDAQASRRALLEAAATLFDERGYHGATVRDIGELAGVDPALIARYFGGKEGLYLAALEQAQRPPGPVNPYDVLARFLAKSEDDGPSNPICLAVISPTLSAPMREQVGGLVDRRIVGPLAEELTARGVDRARLRAELLVATALGATLGRSGGTLPELSAATLDEVRAVLDPLVAVLVGEVG